MKYAWLSEDASSCSRRPCSPLTCSCYPLSSTLPVLGYWPDDVHEGRLRTMFRSKDELSVDDDFLSATLLVRPLPFLTFCRRSSLQADEDSSPPPLLVASFLVLLPLALRSWTNRMGWRSLDGQGVCLLRPASALPYASSCPPLRACQRCRHQGGRLSRRHSCLGACFFPSFK